jgi:hypothetical protein
MGMQENSEYSPVKVLAVASGGGHWDQMMVLRPAFDGFSVRYATTRGDFAARDGIVDVMLLPDSNRFHPFHALRSLIAAVNIVARTRPDVVISTGALPGLCCLALGRMIGARTIWVDSFANAERLSMSGRYARWFATRYLTQWEHLTTAKGPYYEGSLL